MLDAIASLKQTKNGLVEFTFSKGKKMSYLATYATDELVSSVYFWSICGAFYIKERDESINYSGLLELQNNYLSERYSEIEVASKLAKYVVSMLSALAGISSGLPLFRCFPS